jgi:LysM repeat protein
MALEKAIIKLNSGEQIPVLFNPTQYSLEKSNQISELAIPGLSSPILQYVHGSNRTLTMDLFFDTYEQKTDVRFYTDQIYGLLGIEEETHVPPICTFIWGDFSFECVLQRVGGRFTLFLADGTPVRATLSVTFKEYITVDVLVRKEPTAPADRLKTYIVKRGDTLSSIAAAEYGDPGKWRPIALANNIENPRLLQPGPLSIPALR